MKISKLLSLTIIVAATFSLSCNSLLKTFPLASLSTQKTNLVSLLPSSDMVMKINSKRLTNDSIPQILSLAPEAAAKYNEQLKEVQGKSGIDPHSVDEIVVGWTYKSQKPADFNDVDFVGFARGSFDSNALLEASKQSSQNKIHEETIEGKTVYLIDTSAVSDKQMDRGELSDKNNLVETAIANKFKVDQIAMVAFDSNTVVFAKPAQIRSILTEKTTSVNPVLIELLDRHPEAAINIAIDSSFQQNLMSSSIGKESSADAPKIKESLVSLDFDSNGFLMNLTALTPQEEDAKKLEDSFAQGQTSMKQMFGKGTDETSQVIARTIENFKFTRTTTEIQFEAKIPKNDLEKIFKGYAALLSSMFAAGQSQLPGNTDFPSPPLPAKKPASAKY